MVAYPPLKGYTQRITQARATDTVLTLLNAQKGIDSRQMSVILAIDVLKYVLCLGHHRLVWPLSYLVCKVIDKVWWYLTLNFIHYIMHVHIRGHLSKALRYMLRYMRNVDLLHIIHNSIFSKMHFPQRHRCATCSLERRRTSFEHMSHFSDLCS